MEKQEKDGLEFKRCPACNRKTPIAECKQVVSRSNGKTTIGWRCLVCYNIKKNKNRDAVNKRLFAKS